MVPKLICRGVVSRTTQVNNVDIGHEMSSIQLISKSELKFSFKEKSETILITLGCFFLYFRLSDAAVIGQATSTHWLFAALSPYSLILAFTSLFLLFSSRIIAGKRLNVSPLLQFYLAVLFFYSLRIFSIDEVGKSLAGIFVVVMFIFVASSYKDKKRQLIFFRTVEVGIYWFGVLVVLTSLFLFLQGLGYFYQGFRFSGLSFHPNQFGLITALVLIYFLGSLLERNLFRLKKYFLISLILLATFFLFASGSRGGALAAVVGIMYIAIGAGINLARFIGILLVFVITYALFASLNEQSLLIFERLGENTDNRSEVFNVMFEGFISSPFIGLGGDAVGSENSILKALAIGGLMCGLPLIYFVWKLFGDLYKRMLLTSSMKDVLSIAQLKFNAMIVAIMVASLFEGYLFERFGLVAFMLILILSSRIDFRLDQVPVSKGKVVSPKIARFLKS